MWLYQSKNTVILYLAIFSSLLYAAGYFKLNVPNCAFVPNCALLVSSIKEASQVPEPRSINELSEVIQAYDVIIVGAGLSGAVLAERHANVLGNRVLVLEKRDHIAGNCFDYIDHETGIRVSKYGVHLFHTQDKRVWKYVQKFGRWRRWDHKVLAEVNGKYVNVPVNINTVNALFNASIGDSGEMDKWLASVQVVYNHTHRNSEEMAKSRVGEQLYDILIKPYTMKQWNCSPADLDPSVTGRIPVRSNFDDRYFTDRYQFLPEDGYTQLVQRMLGSPRIDVMLNVDFSPDLIKSFKGLVYYTGPIDQYFAYTHERLQYRSLNFKQVIFKEHAGTILPVSQVNYPSMEVAHTRIVEYKHLLNQKSPHTILFYEYSSDVGEPYYPVPSERNHMLYEKYRLMALEETYLKKVCFVGRLANYKYFNMDHAIGNALDYFDAYADVHVVISVYGEDLKWTDKICQAIGPSRRVAFFVYSKKPGRNTVGEELNIAACNTSAVNVSYLPNVGREAHSWITYITRVVRPGHRVIFLQGGEDRFRKRNWIDVIADALQNNHSFVSLSGPDSGIRIGTIHTCLLNCGVDIEVTTRVAKQVAGPQVDMKKLEHNYRAEFVVYGSNVLQVARIFRDELVGWMDEMSEVDTPPIIYSLERLWMEIFKQARVRSMMPR